MSSYDDRELRSLLTPDDRPMPPAELAARIKAEIPADLAFVPHEGVGASRPSGPVWRRRGWLIAASLVTILGGVWLAGRTMTEMPTVDRTEARVGADAARHTKSGTRVASPPTPSAELEVPTEAVSPLVNAEEQGELTFEQPTTKPPATTHPPIDGAAEARERKRIPAPRSKEDHQRVSPSEPLSPSVPRSTSTGVDGRISRPVVPPPAQRARLAQAAAPVPSVAAVADSSVADSSVADSSVADSSVADSSVADSSVDEASVRMRSSSPGEAPERLGQGFGTQSSVQTATSSRLGLVERTKRAVPAQVDRPGIATSFQPRSNFPLVVDSGSYALVRGLVDEGVWPPPEVVRVNAMVNRFDYGDAPPPLGEDFALHAEGTSMPPEGEGARRIMLRLGVRTRAFSDDPGTRDGGAVAMAARAWVSFNPAVVAQYRLLGHGDRRQVDDDPGGVAAVGAIHVGHMATALYEVELQPHVAIGPGWRDDVAVLHLDWKTAATGATVTRSRPITGEDFAVDWRWASATLRWSVLVARLAEALQRDESDAALAVLREETERLSPLLFHHPGFVGFRALVERVDSLPR